MVWRRDWEFSVIGLLSMKTLTRTDYISLGNHCHWLISITFRPLGHLYSASQSLCSSFSEAARLKFGQVLMTRPMPQRRKTLMSGKEKGALLWSNTCSCFRSILVSVQNMICSCSSKPLSMYQSIMSWKNCHLRLPSLDVSVLPIVE